MQIIDWEKCPIELYRWKFYVPGFKLDISGILIPEILL